MDNGAGTNCSLFANGGYHSSATAGWRLPQTNSSNDVAENDFGSNSNFKIPSSNIPNFFYPCPESSQSASNSGGFYSVETNCSAGFHDMNSYYSRVAAGFNQSFDLIPQHQSFVRLNSTGLSETEQLSYMNPNLQNSFQRNLSYPIYSNNCPSNANIGGISMVQGSSSSFLASNYSGMQQSIQVMNQGDIEYETRELEAFAEWFKQRRIKLRVTQADVGRALGNLKLAGVGSLSQSTICRFESLTLSHNNMIALKPVLQTWLEDAETEAKERLNGSDAFSDIDERKRKRTSITDSEKRSLEAFFTIQPRPSSEKIIQIAEKLNLKKNVVRVWFCNQRQKQKRMKFSTLGFQHSS